MTDAARAGIDVHGKTAIISTHPNYWRVQTRSPCTPGLPPETAPRGNSVCERFVLHPIVREREDARNNAFQSCTCLAVATVDRTRHYQPLKLDHSRTSHCPGIANRLRFFFFENERPATPICELSCFTMNAGLENLARGIYVQSKSTLPLHLATS